MDILTDILLTMDDENEVPEREVRRIQYGVEHIVHQLFNRVAAMDSRFRMNKIHSVGSYYDETKVSKPDEFDYLIELVDLKDDSKLSIHEPCYGNYNISQHFKKNHGLYKKIQIIDEELIHKWMQEQDDVCKNIGTRSRPIYILDQIEVKNALHSTISKTWKDFTPSLPRCFSVGGPPDLGSGPSLGLNLTWTGRAFTHLNISVDLTIAIPIKKWPNYYNFQRRMNPGHPLRAALCELVDEYGHHLVPYVDSEGKIFDSVWKVSSSLVENKFFTRLSMDSRPKTLIRLFKRIKQKFFTYDAAELLPGLYTDGVHDKDTNKELISSYMIKQSVLHLMYVVPIELWTEQSISYWFLDLLKFLFDTLQRQSLRDFFNFGHKLHMPDEGNKCTEGFVQLLEELKETYNQNGYVSTEFQTVLDYIPSVVKGCDEWVARFHEFRNMIPEEVRDADRSEICPLPAGECYDQHPYTCPARNRELEITIAMLVKGI